MLAPEASSPRALRRRLALALHLGFSRNGGRLKLALQACDSPLTSRTSHPNSGRSSRFTISLRRHPFTHFGLPFLGLIVLSSFALTSFTQTRYDLRDQKVQSVSKEEELGMRKDRRKINARDEYYVRFTAPRFEGASSVLPPAFVHKRGTDGVAVSAALDSVSSPALSPRFASRSTPSTLRSRTRPPSARHGQRMQALDQLGESDAYENKRVERLPGQAEWGELPVARKEP